LGALWRPKAAPAISSPSLPDFSSPITNNQLPITDSHLPATVYRLPITDSPSPTPESEEDRNWRRLETIMRRHKEQQTAEETTPPISGVQPIAQTTTTQRQPDQPASPKPMPAKQISPTPKGRIAPNTSVANFTASSLPGRPPETAVHPATPETPYPTEPLSGNISPEPATVIAAPGEPIPAVPPMALETAVAPLLPAMPLTAEVLRTEAESEPAPVLQQPLPVVTSAPAEDETISDEQTMPLQAIWPVQTIQRAETRPSPLATPASETSLLLTPIFSPTPQDAWVQERIATVPPAMPTTSSVPLMRPRYPRPTNPGPSNPTTTPLPTADRPLPTDDISPMTVHESLLTKNQLPITNNQSPITDYRLPITDSLQRQPESQDMIQTEIGDLPADLWRLIGQQPPVARPSPSLTSSPATPTQTARLAAPQAAQVATPSSTPVVQREMASEAVGSAVGGVETAVSSLTDGEPEADQKAQEVDIDELSRQVYAQLKRRLTAEKERERGRLTHNW
jgi:hypothetical protein